MSISKLPKLVVDNTEMCYIFGSSFVVMKFLREVSLSQAHLLEQFEPGNVMLYDSFTAVQESWQEILSGMLDFSVISTNKTCLDFNRSKLLVEFNEETHRCCSCKVRRNGSECVYEDACPHVVCKSCLQRHYHKYDPES